MFSKLFNILRSDGRTLYVGSRGFASFLALVLSVVYSRELGVDKRSVLTFILVASLICATFLISPYSLTYRKITLRSKNVNDIHTTYSFLLVVISILATVVSTLSLYFFDTYVTSVPKNLFVASAIYTFTSSLAYGIQDILVACHKIRTNAIFDVATAVLQIITFFILTYYSKTSLIVSVLLSLSMPYFLTSFTIFTLIFNLYSPPSLFSFKLLLKGIRKNSVTSLSLSILDRYDKLLIAFLLPISFLGKYSVITGFVSIFRFLPDSYARSVFLPNNQISANRPTRAFYLFIIAALLLIPISIEGLISIALGDVWLISTFFILLVTIQEFGRAFFQYRLNLNIRSGFENKAFRASVVCLGVALVTVPLSIWSYGVYGPPIVLSLIYFFIAIWLGGESA